MCVFGFTLVLAPAAGANSARSMRPIVTKVGVSGHRGLVRDLHAISHRARAAIVGGARISISQAPWQVLVLALISRTEGIFCGGSILNNDEILTAAHCVYDPETRERIPADQIVVAAGTADVDVEEPEEQASLAANVRVHPYYEYDPEAREPVPDDVAVVDLNTPLTFSPGVQAIELASAGPPFAEGTSLNLTGFGQENPLEELSGELHSIGMTVGFSRECGGESDALFLCASSPNGSDCFGDSGSALTLPGSPSTQVGVTDTVEVIEGKACLDGADGGYADIAAPEIRDFILEDNAAPPRAPRGGGVSLHGAAIVGSGLSCESGFWSDSPKFSYSFVNSADRQVLQSGAVSTYALTSADVGRTIACEVLASNAGGTGVARTSALAPVRRPTGEEEAARRRQEEEVNRTKLEEEAASKKAQEAVANEHEEEEAAAVERHQEEQLAKGQVLGVMEASPDATLVSSSLQVRGSGVVKLEIGCPKSESDCTGTVALRTLHAVAASAVSAKTKAAVLTLATASFDIAGGAVKAVTLKLSAEARVLLARVRLLRIRVTIVARNAGGATHREQMDATLRASKYGKR